MLHILTTQFAISTGHKTLAQQTLDLLILCKKIVAQQL